MQHSLTDPALALDGVARRFAHQWVLRGVDLRVDAGAVTGLLGRNGSGKTTLLRIAATALRPTRGGVRVFGRDALADAASVRPLVGLLGHAAGVYDELTAAENLRFAMRMAGQPASPAAIAAVLERVALRRAHDQLVRGFSAGMRRRLALARLMLRPPRLLLLDEPYASFDADGIATVNAFAAEIARSGGAVLMTTHDLERGAGVIDRTVLLENGRVAGGTPVPGSGDAASQTRRAPGLRPAGADAVAPAPSGWPAQAVG